MGAEAMMDLRTLASVVGGIQRGANAGFSRVTHDSRDVKPGDLFIALQGERFNGHDFVDAAFAQGAVAALVEKGRSDRLRGSLVATDDPLVALGKLAAHWRQRFTLPLVAVAGSNGKTTVKEMIASIFRKAVSEPEQVLASQGNFNNQIGLPLTLLQLREVHRYGVVEIGMNHRGETGYLANILRPTIAVINNAQREHQEFMQSVVEVAIEHATLLEWLPDNGVAVINADDGFAPYWRRSAQACFVLDFGLSHSALVSARIDPKGNDEIEVQAADHCVRFNLPLPGRHNVYNALAAIAATTAAGIDLGVAADALSGFQPVKGRLEIKVSPSGARVLDDTYNANPDSVRAALEVMRGFSGKKIFILGDMGEVGDQGIAYHEEAGRYARDADIDLLFSVGALSAHSAGAFGGGEHFTDVAQLVARAREELASDVTVLVKGSRFMRMERVVDALLSSEETTACG